MSIQTDAEARIVRSGVTTQVLKETHFEDGSVARSGITYGVVEAEVSLLSTGHVTGKTPTDGSVTIRSNCTLFWSDWVWGNTRYATIDKVSGWWYRLDSGWNWRYAELLAGEVDGFDSWSDSLSVGIPIQYDPNNEDDTVYKLDPDVPAIEFISSEFQHLHGKTKIQMYRGYPEQTFWFLVEIDVHGWGVGQ